MRCNRYTLPTIPDPNGDIPSVLGLRRHRELERQMRREKWLCWLTAGFLPRQAKAPAPPRTTAPAPQRYQHPADPAPAAAPPPRRVDTAERRRPRAARVRHAEPDPELSSRPPRLTSPRAVPTATVLLAGAVTIALLASLLAVALAGRRTDPTQASQAAATADPGPTGFAETFVTTWLGAGEDHHAQLEGLVAGPVDLAGVPSGSFQALSATALSATPLAERYWSVLVAVEQVQRVVDPDTRRASWQADGTHYYRVGVYGASGHYLATGPPGEISRPSPADAPGALVDALATPDGADARTDRVRRFLAAFLTGQGALEDSIAPGRSAAPIDPVPYAQVELRAVGYSAPPTSPETTAQATVAATTPTGNVEVLGYSLQLARRDGRWYVAGLDGAAALKPSTSHP